MGLNRLFGRYRVPVTTNLMAHVCLTVRISVCAVNKHNLYLLSHRPYEKIKSTINHSLDSWRPTRRFLYFLQLTKKQSVHQNSTFPQKEGESLLLWIRNQINNKCLHLHCRFWNLLKDKIVNSPRNCIHINFRPMRCKLNGDNCRKQ